MDFVMVSRPEKMFFRHKQADGNFYDVFLFFWWIFLLRKSTRARGNLGTQEIGRLISIAVTGRENSHENGSFFVYLFLRAPTPDISQHTWGTRVVGA